MRPRSGRSNPATERSSVVLPLPDGPKSARISPRSSWSDTPRRISFSPSRFAISSATSSGIEAHPQAQRGEERRADDDDFHDRQRRNEIERARAPQRDDQRADHFRAGAEKINAGRVLAHEHHEDQEPAADQAEADERHSTALAGVFLWGRGGG